MDRLFTSRIAKGLQGPISYVASLCISVGTYHTLVDQKFVQEMLPNVSCNHHSQVQGCAGVVGAVYVYSCGGGAVLGRAAGSVMQHRHLCVDEVNQQYDRMHAVSCTSVSMQVAAVSQP